MSRSGREKESVVAEQKTGWALIRALTSNHLAGPAIAPGLCFSGSHQMTVTSSSPTSTAPPPDDWLVRHVERQFREAAILATNTAVLLRALARAGISTVIVIFDCSADSGQVKSVEVRIGNTRVTFPDHRADILQLDCEEIEPRRYSMSLAAAVKTVFWDILAVKQHGRLHNNGALGEFTIDVPGDRIKLDHGEMRYESCVRAFEGGQNG